MNQVKGEIWRYEGQTWTALDAKGELAGEKILAIYLEAGDWVVFEVKAFSGEAPQGDDQTVVVLKVELQAGS